MKNIFLLFFLGSFTYVTAQVTHQQTYWLRFFTRVKLDSNWAWHLEADERRFILPDKQMQFIAHTRIHRKIGKKMEVSLGTSFSDVRQGLIDVKEYRLFQEFYLFHYLTPKLRLSNRLVAEQRRFENVEKGMVVSGFNMKYRYRYRPQIDFRLNKKWAFKTNGELMYHTTTYDQSRFYISTQHFFNRMYSVELGYLKTHQQRASGGIYERDNLRTTLFIDF